MIRLLFRWFKPQFIKLAFETQSKKQWLKDTEFAFIDSEGRKYYRFINDMDIPIIRKGNLERLLIEANSKLSRSELNMFLDAMSKTINDVIDTSNQKKKVEGIAKIMHLIEEMKRREEMIIHPELMFEIVSALYIREDEDPATWDEDIHTKKVSQFKKDSKAGLYDFFHQSGLATYLPSLPQLKENLPKYMEETLAMMEKHYQYLISILEEDSLKNETMITK